MFLLGLQIKIMSKNTFMMIKPDAVERGLVGDILRDITDAGFKIKAFSPVAMYSEYLFCSINL